MRLVGLGVLLCANPSFHVFRTVLKMGACRANASCKSCRLVMRLSNLACFSKAS